MSVSIHYRGCIDNKTQVHQLMEEIQDIAETMDWKYNCLNENWKKKSQLALERRENATHITGHAGLKGISFSPHPDCETIWLCFDSKGCISSPMSLVMQNDDESADEMNWLAVKTQFAGTETHIAIVKLFKYLKSKYMSNLEVEDESGYWETNDRTVLASKMNELNEAIDMITSALSTLPVSSDDDAKSVVQKIERLLRGLGFERSPNDDI